MIADLLLGPLDHAVALTRHRRHDLSRTGDLEALFSARLGLHLGHFGSPGAGLDATRHSRKAKAQRPPDGCSTVSNARNERKPAATAALFSRAARRADLWQRRAKRSIKTD